MELQTTSLIVAELERAWAALRAAHHDIPASVLVVASGGKAARDGRFKLGHYAHARWHVSDARLPEVLISAEGLQRGGADIFATLVHEAAHGIAATREIKDCSREGRYHNEKFRALATEVGLEVEKDDKFGWCITKMPKHTAERWAKSIEALDKAISGHRAHEQSPEEKAKKASRMLLAVCLCGSKIRLSRAVYDAAPITCGECEHDFKIEEDLADHADED